VSITVNYLAVLVAAVVSFFLGFLWHGPLFGKAWREARGVTPEMMEKGKKEMPRFMATVFVSLFVVAWGLAVIVGYTHLVTVMQGAELGLMAWFAFALTVGAVEGMMATGRRMPQFLISTGSWLVTFVVSGIIVSYWH
jgi:hypothetical protein